ncbi:MAG: HAD hydrolase-like protein [Calditrichae bacterium]|nr:HAD hydrolase-like protein [Calditrichia bacterium]
MDGTLILSGGRGREAMIAAMQTEFNCSIDGEFKDFAGSTDRLIVRTLMKRNGIELQNVEEMIDRIMERYLENLKPALANPSIVEVLPGIREILNATFHNGEFGLGLVTGNIEAGARLKLGSVGLNRYFAVGAFGSDAVDRHVLPPIAVKRAESYFQHTFKSRNIWIIGDTPRDIHCAQSNGLRSLAVATGGCKLSSLKKHHPDVVLEDLSDTERVLQLFHS